MRSNRKSITKSDLMHDDGLLMFIPVKIFVRLRLEGNDEPDDIGNSTSGRSRICELS